MILFDDRSLSHHHFQTLITLKTAFFKKNSSRHTSCFEVRNLRRFLKVIFLYLASAIRARWDLIIQSSDDFFVGIPINDKNFFKQSDFSIEVEWCQIALFLV